MNKKAVIYYRSKTGITRRFAEEIKLFLNQFNLNVNMFSVFDYNQEQLVDADIVLLGAWTHGLFIFGQHPDKQWVDFAINLPLLSNQKIILFTTYKLFTGSMFKKMYKHLRIKEKSDILELKSKDGRLTEDNKELITKFLY